MEKKYYKSLEELSLVIDQESGQEILGDKKSILALQTEAKSGNGPTRRDFLKIFGFTVASAAVASSCEQPVRKAIPYLIQPEEMVPGKASYYASTFYDGVDYCSILVKVRDGRPIKIEGNTLSTVSRGGTSARTQASVLNLYDNSRHTKPAIKGEETSWEQMDQQLVPLLEAINQKGGKIVILSSSIISPSTKAAISLFASHYTNTEHVQYDVISASGMLQANETAFGKAFIPAYHFERAKLIVSFDADFLGSWLSPVEFTKQYTANRKLHEGKKTMSRHLQYEGGMSLTGSNADKRLMLKPSEQKATIATLYNELVQLTTGTQNTTNASLDMAPLAAELLEAKGESLVVCGSNDTETQLLVVAINALLGNYGNTIDTGVHLKVRQGIDSNMASLVDEMNAGAVDGIILYDVNPVYDYPDREKFISGLQKVGLKIAMPVLNEETSVYADYICPDHHYLEAWNDAEVKTGHYSLAQPAIRPIFSTRAAQESLLAWCGSKMDFRKFIQEYWEKNLFPKAGFAGTFTAFWNEKLHDGVYNSGEKELEVVAYKAPELGAIVQNIKGNEAEAVDLDLYFNISVGTGKYANNPWLQELPDPITKACWDNYACVSQKLADQYGLADESLITINKLGPFPVLIQPGQEANTVSIALGYGREKAGLASEGVGVNAYPLVTLSNGNRSFELSGVTIEKVSGEYKIARTQTHHSMEGREIIRETNLGAYLEDPKSGNEVREEILAHMKTLYPKKDYDGLHWGMAIDLNSCTGCNACIVACSAENNVPVVGKEQVLKAREMHWIRIDRYYTGDPENPELVRQPIMCQHCDNAPCENVCPVAATTHSNEGINQMAYNRCIGTRYCNNNCPYKVRRFNFFDYTNSDAFTGNLHDTANMETDLRKLVLNPDVVTRAKGVIEKCSFCIQRIQEKKLDAKMENRMLADGEVQPACAQSCPADAIIFGNLNDSNSKVSKMFADERNYHVLEELHVMPSVGYLTKVKNTNA
ncbi:MAG: 4Fe-4S dicluster domain-containing protein [Bacteroidetes bacterium]|nr:4Fe-4S dicluster domain-containing protein [Bacteroidota bacterium]